MLTSLLDALPVGVAVLDAELRVVQTNAFMNTLLGHPPSALKMQPLPALWPSLVAFLSLDHAQVVATGQPTAPRTQVVVTPGATDAPRTLRMRLHPVILPETTTPGLCLVVEDLDGHHRAVDLALEKERQHRVAILQSLQEGVIAFRPDGTIALVNAAAQHLANLHGPTDATTLTQAHKASGWKLDDPQDKACPEHEWPSNRVLRGETFTELVVHMPPSEPGKDRWLAYHGTPVKDEQGRLMLGVLSIEDITERKRAEAALKAHAEQLSRTNAELARALRLREDFLAMMSHELRTPLNTVLGLTEALDDELYGPLSPRQRLALSRVTQSGQRLLSILSDILDLTHIGTGTTRLDRKPIDVDRFSRSTLQMIQSAAQAKHIELRLSIAPGVEGLLADEGRLTQMVFNLLDNAVKFTPTDGSVGLDVSVDREHEQIRFVVWDTGIGIAATDCERLFQPFTQVDEGLARQYGGVGLGLSLVRLLVDLHRGSVRLESTPGQGSRFIVSLPWNPADNAVLQTDELDLPRWTIPPRVVVADDHEITLDAYLELLTSQGCEVVGARTGEEALAQVHATRPDVVVMDIQMPGMDGLTAIRHLRDDPEWRQVPIIALTALVKPDDRERCLSAGATRYLAKPVSVRRMLETIAEVLHQASHAVKRGEPRARAR